MSRWLLSAAVVAVLGCATSPAYTACARAVCVCGAQLQQCCVPRLPGFPASSSSLRVAPSPFYFSEF